MSRRYELPDVHEIPSVDDEPAVFDPEPEWFVPGLTPLRGEAPEEEDDDLGLRAILERPEALAKAWHASGPRRRKAKKKLTSAREESSRPAEGLLHRLTRPSIHRIDGGGVRGRLSGDRRKEGVL